ncbi:hypothetical protein BT96DRAFT_971462 [Gymnopus androsaceus JB14]|uniref:Uncharacterized protein n=1 Tax=Gymnopus androsaceus JB14 TaxID=1447944 RepID=A0A6A4IB68_9AGAR|nr:hypothetical protein BT96DRAFT_971462 [Gymnopus androsaceus JB14]
MPKQPPIHHLHNRLPVIPGTERLKIVPAACTRPRPTKPRNKFEAAALKIHPSLKLPDNFFLTDAEIDAELDAIDAEIEEDEIDADLQIGKKTERVGSKLIQPYQREARRERYHGRWNDLFERAGRETMQVWGVTSPLQLKPQNGDRVHTIPIPDSGFAIRFWDNGLDEQNNKCCLDFISSLTHRAKNSPESWQLLPANKFGALPFNPILSREEVVGYKKKNIPPGEERFDIERPGYPDFVFDVPGSNCRAAQARESRAAA